MAQSAIKRITEKTVYQCKYVDEANDDMYRYIRLPQSFLTRRQIHCVLVIPIVFCRQRRQGDNQIDEWDGMENQIFIGRDGKNSCKKTEGEKLVCREDCVPNETRFADFTGLTLAATAKPA